MATVTYEEIDIQPTDLPALNKVKKKAHKAACDLLSKLDTLVNKADKNWKNVHTICTSESLTAGMILSTLVDIPWGGLHKYGGFAVYDTDAKRVFNKVAVDNVYTHRCAKEMAIGVLKNSNATVAISVTGNAMPDPINKDKLGEVFIGVAGYINNGNDTKIIYDTMMMNACADIDMPEFKKTCKAWHRTLKTAGAYNKRSQTALISQEIRYYTTCKALEFCLQFVTDNILSVPEFVDDRKKRNSTTAYQSLHTDTPENKYNENLDEIHVSKVYNTSTPNRHTGDIALYIPSPSSLKSDMSNKTPPARASIYTISSDEFRLRQNGFKSLSGTRKAARSTSRNRSNQSNSKSKSKSKSKYKSKYRSGTSV